MSRKNPLTDISFIEKARLALESGDKQSAKKLAKKATHLNPESEDAWLILAAVSELHQSIEYLNHALEINPKSVKARKGLRWAARQLKDLPSTGKQDIYSSSNQKQNENRINGLHRNRKKNLRTTEQKEKNDPEITISNNRWPIPLFLTILVTGSIAFCVLGIPSIEALAYSEKSPRPENALPKPTLTPTLTPTPTATPSPIPTALPTETPLPAGTADQDFTSYQYHSWDIPDQVSGTDDFWVEVDLTGQILYTYRGDRLISSFLVSTGTNSYPTITGTYKIYAKFPTYTMRGPGYDLPDVPYSMFFYKGYSIHGTYWHNNFGIPMSHGCINMQTDDAAWLYDHVKIGTYVFVHY